MSGRLAVAMVVAAFVVAGAAIAPFVFSDAAPADLSAVDAYEDLVTTHVEGEVEYEQSPPVGGEHDAEWLECGVYERPVRDENAVHSLEHGTVWITYDPDSVDDDEIGELARALPQFGILSPHEDQDAPVVVTVWERQLALEGADDERLGMFLDEYGDGATAPERGVGCFGGVVVYDDAGQAA